MALRNLFDQTNNQYVFSTVDASALEINNVPISTGGLGTQNLQQVLNTGADAGNQSITNLNSINMNGYLNLNSASLGQVHFNNGTNSWQLLSSNDEFFIQNYVNNSLVSQSFLIDNDGNLLLGNSKSATPYLYVMGINGPGRVYDTLYNPLPSVPSGGSNYSIISKNWILNTVNQSSAIVYNTTTKSNYMNIYTNLNPSTNFEGMSHFKVSISSISFTISPPDVFSMGFLLIDNKTDLTTLTASDIAKNIVSPTMPAGGGTTFILSDIDLEFYDASGINSLSIIANTTFTGPSMFINSMVFSVIGDNATYTYQVPQITY